VTLKTRREEDEVGFMVETSESKIDSTSEIAAAKGTSISVRNLFFNIPARRKFLKSDAAELRHIITEFTKIAIVNPSVAFTLKSNEKLIYELKQASSIKQRIVEICGNAINKELLEVDTDTNMVKISGFIGTPQEAKKAAGNQYLFVNGRYFRSPYFHKAICKQYEGLVREGHIPSYFLFLEVEPASIDVNIHPAKTEVKFEDESALFEIVGAAIRRSLGKNAFVPTFDFNAPSVGIEIPIATAKPSYTHTPKINYDPLFNPFDSQKKGSAITPNVAFEEETGQMIDRASNYGKLFEEREVSAEGIAVIANRYIAMPVASGLMVINVLRARERILYDRFFPLMAERQPIIQRSLYPKVIELSPADHTLLLESLDLINRLGFDIRDFGGNSIIVYGLPEGFQFDDDKIEVMIGDMVQAISDGSLTDEGPAKAALSLAHAAALSAKGSLTTKEAKELADALQASTDSAVTADGKRCYSIITKEELERRF
ncbi:MAG: hypothetical protein HUJ90_07040, partial [Bacteroidales bacterium]|nr:hypothetical protein [Bacteroidales bacterium]